MTILVVEDQTMVREMLQLACAEAHPEATVKLAADCRSAIDAFGRFSPDLVILDLVLPDGDGLDLLKPLFGTAPKAKVIVLSSHFDEFTLHRALGAAVHGILDKNAQPIRSLGDAITTVMSGGSYIAPSVRQLANSLRSDPNAFDKLLSNREQAVLRYVGEGFSNEKVASLLGISVSTAKHHRLNIMAKLNLHSTAELIRYALDRGFTRLKTKGSKAES